MWSPGPPGTYVRHMNERPPAEVWRGQPSGERFAELVRQRAESLGMDITVDVISDQLAGSYRVDAHWSEPLDGDVAFEVVDWWDEVRIFDLRDEDVSISDAMSYFAARVRGLSPREALRSVCPERPEPWLRSLLRRWRRK